MARKWTHTAAFEHFGATPRNVQWSWTARSVDGKTVVATLWQDQFVRKDGRVTYARPGLTPGERKRPGMTEQTENFGWARDHCDGRFHVIVAIARNKNADPRSIEECFPSKMVMRLTHLDTTTGAYAAEAEGI
jgi:hypothetical protein